MAVAPQTTSPRYDYIDGLRGIAILAVLLCHCWHLCGKYAVSIGRVNVLQVLDYGYLGVHLFLLLSGFCLALPLARRAEAGKTFARVAVGDFARRRAERILPPYYASIALVAVLALVFGAIHRANNLPPSPVQMPTVGSVIAHALMLHNFVPHYVFDIVASYWSLGLEVQFYVLFPLLVLAARKWGLWSMVAGVAILTLAYRVAVWVMMPLQVIPGHPNELIQIGTGIGFTSLAPGRLFEFALGMAAAVLITRQSWNVAPGKLAAACALFVALGVALTLFWGRFAPLTDIVLGVGFFFGLLASASHPGVRRFAEWKPLVGLGFISYSVYLVHEPFLHEAYALLKPLQLDGWTALLVFEGLLLPLLIAIGYGFHCLAERPLLRRKARVRLSESPAASATAAISTTPEPRP